EGAIRSATRVPVGLLEPVRAAEALFEFARGRLERIELPAPARALRLVADALPPFVPARRDLFDIRPGAGLDWPQLAERLRARLGDKAVRSFALHPDHRPERAWRSCTAVAAGAGAPGPGQHAARRPAAGARAGHAAAAGAGASGRAGARHGSGGIATSTRTGSDGNAHRDRPLHPRPIWLLPRPLPLRGHVARLLSGPERIETGWWDGYDI